MLCAPHRQNNDSIPTWSKGMSSPPGRFFGRFGNQIYSAPVWKKPAFRGFLWAMCSNTSFVAIMILNKVFRQEFPVMWLVWGRCLFALLLVVPFLRWSNLKVLWGVQALRGVVVAGAMVCSYTAYRHLPSHFAALIGASSALFTVVLARIFLKEPVDSKRMIALAIGYCGVLILLSDAIHTSWSHYVVWALAGNALAATTAILSKWLTLRSIHPQSSMVYGIVVPLMAFSVILYVDPQWHQIKLGAYQWQLLAVLGGIGACIQYSLLRAYQVAKASFVAPLEYARLCLMIPAGYVFLGEIPTLWSYVGGAVIVGISICFVRWETTES
jgi:drug/metabolite transporter (DMT)-like permease